MSMASALHTCDLGDPVGQGELKRQPVFVSDHGWEHYSYVTRGRLASPNNFASSQRRGSKERGMCGQRIGVRLKGVGEDVPLAVTTSGSKTIPGADRRINL